MGNKPLDLTGKKFGKLTAIRMTGEKEKGYIVWECKCDCGNTTTASANALSRGLKKSCGCLRGKKLPPNVEPPKTEELSGVELLSELNWMCNSYHRTNFCSALCPLAIEKLKHDGDIKCFDLLKKKEPERVVQLIDRWSKSTPKKTRLTYLKSLPIEPIYRDGYPIICAGDLFGFNCDNPNECRKCWDTRMGY